jgi:predicted RNase H-like HicB family nuclease
MPPPVFRDSRDLSSQFAALDYSMFRGGLNGRRSLAEYDEGVNLTIELDREDDGRWIAEALELPGVLCYGQTRDEAIGNAERLAIEVIADRIAHGELPSSALGVSFSIPDEQRARQ